MKEITNNGYMVLSVKDLRRIIKEARTHSKVRYGGKIVGHCCISLDLHIYDENEFKVKDARQVAFRGFK